MLITFEGLDCSGKTTQGGILVNKLKALPREGKGGARAVHFIREPGGTQISERIRSILLDRKHAQLTDVTELLLFSASRAQLVHEVILPALDRGESVVCDRYYDSTTAYQGYGRGLDLRVIEKINTMVTAGVKPHLTILIDIPLEEVERRKTALGLGLDRMESSGRPFYERVRNGYLKIAEEEPARVAVINGVESVEKVATTIWRLVETRLDQSRIHSRALP